MEYIEGKSQKEEKELFIFTLGEKLYSVEAKQILEIIKLIELDIPEKLPKHVVGILKFESYFMNVADMKSLLGLDIAKYNPDNKILIISSEDSVFGIVIDKIIGSKKIDANLIQVSPYKNDDSLSEAFFDLDNKIVTVLDINLIDNKIKHSINYETSKLSISLFPDDAESIKLLKERKEEFQKKSGLDELISCSMEQDAITFEINENKYCVKISCVKYFYKLKNGDNIVKIPSVKDFVLGILNVKGEFLTIVDVEKQLNIGKTEAKKNSIIIVVQIEDYKIGILADKIGDKINIEHEIENHSLDKTNDNEGIVNFISDESIYTAILPEELFKIEKFKI